MKVRISCSSIKFSKWISLWSYMPVTSICGLLFYIKIRRCGCLLLGVIITTGIKMFQWRKTKPSVSGMKYSLCSLWSHLSLQAHLWWCLVSKNSLNFTVNLRILTFFPLRSRTIGRRQNSTPCALGRGLKTSQFADFRYPKSNIDSSKWLKDVNTSTPSGWAFSLVSLIRPKF